MKILLNDGIFASVRGKNIGIVALKVKVSASTLVCLLLESERNATLMSHTDKETMKRLTYLLPLLLVSCLQNGNQSRVLNEEELVDAYVELLDSASTDKTDHPDSLLSPVAERILERRNIEVSEFNATVREYNNDTRKWEAFYARVVRRIRDRDSTEAAERATQAEPAR